MASSNSAIRPILSQIPEGETIADLIVAKNRSGQTGVVKLRWIAEQMRFANLDDPIEPEPLPATTGDLWGTN